MRSSLLQRSLLVVETLSAASFVWAGDFNPYVGPQPIVVLIEKSCWGEAGGSQLERGAIYEPFDSPRLIVYEDGEVVFAKGSERLPTYWRTKLDDSAFGKVREQLKPTMAIKGLKPLYNIQPNLTDQTTSLFYLRDGDQTVTSSVYGLLEVDGHFAEVDEEAAYDEKSLIPPSELLELHRRLCKLDLPAAKPWRPKYVEVVLWDYNGVPDSTEPWPKEWPRLNSDRASKHGKMRSLFLDGEHGEKLFTVLQNRETFETFALDIEGRKMDFDVWPSFPSEPVWRKALYKFPADE